MASAGHLVRRFVSSLRPGGPSRADAAWVATQLLPAELELWASMSAADRRHAVGVARRAVASLGEARARRPVVAAALLHDVGKTVSHLSTLSRVGATVVIGVAGRDRVASWTEERGMARRVALYAAHPQLGADLLALAGSDPLTIAWAAEHHLAEDSSSLPDELAAALRAADDD